MKHTLITLALTTVLALGCSSRESVVIYSPHGQEVLSEYQQRFETLHSDVRVQWLDMGSKDVHMRIAAERARPACDVWWGGPHTFFQQAAEEGLLAEWRPAWADTIDANLKSDTGLWYATHLSPIVILFNNRAYEAHEMPQGWDELLEPEWNDKIVIRKPLESGTMRTFLCAMIDRQASEDVGIEWLRQLHEQTVAYPESPTLLFDHLKKNEDRISIWLLPDIMMQRDLNGYPFGYHVPNPAPVLAEGIGIVADAPHRERAEQFVEFVTSEESLLHQAKRYGKLPARQDIAREALPGELARIAVVPMEIDWEHFAAQENAWLTRWEEEVYGGR